MRLPFGLGRRSSSGNGASGGGYTAGSGAAPARPASAPSRAWASLPPIQRTAGPMPQVAAPRAFVGALPGSNGLPPIVQPLGHEVSPLATPGLVVARVRPVEAAGTGSIPAPVQRRARGGSRQTAAVAPEAVADAEPMEAGHDATVASSPAVAAIATAPIRTMPTVSRLAVHVPDRPLTSAASAARPAAVQRAAAAASASLAAPSAVVPVPPSGGMRRVPSAMPLAKPVVSRQASSNADERAPSAPSSQATVTRSGLGEPLTSVPASARPLGAGAPGPVVSRSTTSGPMPIAAASLRSPVQRSAADGGAGGPVLALGPGSAGPAAPQPSAASLPALPHLPVARSATAASPRVADAAPAVATTVPAPEIRPLAGSNPIRTSIGLQREAADDLDDGADDDATLPSPWWAPATETAAQPSLAGPAAGAPSTSLQRSAAGIAPSPVISPFVAGVAPTAQRTAPAVGPTRVQRTGGKAVRQGMPEMTLPRDPSHRTNGASAVPAESSIPAVSSPARTPGGGAMVQMSPAPASASFAGAPGLGAVAQRQGTVPLAAEPEVPAAPAAPATPGGSSGSGGSAGSSHSERDLDELAQALFGRIRGRIRSDLIQDREAKGLTFDHV